VLKLLTPYKQVTWYCACAVARNSYCQ